MQQFLYRIEPVRPAMLTEGPTALETKIVGEHFAYLEKLVAQGTVLMAGRTLNPESAFGIVVLQAQSPEKAEEICQNDPAVRQGVMKAGLFPYSIALWSPTGPENRAAA